jgi:hypothetical protein
MPLKKPLLVFLFLILVPIAATVARCFWLDASNRGAERTTKAFARRANLLPVEKNGSPPRLTE